MVWSVALLRAASASQASLTSFVAPHWKGEMDSLSYLSILLLLPPRPGSRGRKNKKWFIFWVRTKVVYVLVHISYVICHWVQQRRIRVNYFSTIFLASLDPILKAPLLLWYLPFSYELSKNSWYISIARYFFHFFCMKRQKKEREQYSLLFFLSRQYLYLER